MRARFLSLSRSLRVRSAVALAAASMPVAYEVREQLRDDSELYTAVRDPIAAKQRVEKRFVFEQPPNNDSHAGGHDAAHRIHTLKISAPGLTVVSVDPTTNNNKNAQQQLCSVRVSADHLELLDCLEVVPLAPHGIEIRFKHDTPAVTGHLLTELSLANREDVNIVDASGHGVVVIEPNVLVTYNKHAALALALRGHGELFVDAPSTAVDVERLVLQVTGTGRLQFAAASVHAANDILLQVTGGGNAELFAQDDINTSTLKTTIAGAGHVLTAADNLVTTKLKSSITGVGDVKHVGRGRAAVQRVAITGSGSVATPFVTSDNATVQLFGAGDATIDVRDALDATSRGWGVVRYVNALPPASVTTSNGLVLERARAAVRRQSPVCAASVPTKSDAFDDIAVAFDPEVAAMERRHHVDVFGAIRAVKSMLNDRGAADDSADVSVDDEASTGEAP